MLAEVQTEVVGDFWGASIFPGSKGEWSLLRNYMAPMVEWLKQDDATVLLKQWNTIDPAKNACMSFCQHDHVETNVQKRGHVLNQ